MGALEEQINFDDVREEIVYQTDPERKGDQNVNLPTIARRDEIYESVESWQRET